MAVSRPCQGKLPTTARSYLEDGLPGLGGYVVNNDGFNVRLGLWDPFRNSWLIMGGDSNYLALSGVILQVMDLFGP